jgi:hypothetical protein
VAGIGGTGGGRLLDDTDVKEPLRLSLFMNEPFEDGTVCDRDGYVRDGERGGIGPELVEASDRSGTKVHVESERSPNLPVIDARLEVGPPPLCFVRTVSSNPLKLSSTLFPSASTAAISALSSAALFSVSSYWVGSVAWR